MKILKIVYEICLIGSGLTAGIMISKGIVLFGILSGVFGMGLTLCYNFKEEKNE